MDRVLISILFISAYTAFECHKLNLLSYKKVLYFKKLYDAFLLLDIIKCYKKDVY